MEIKLPKSLFDKFEAADLDMEVSLAWVLGYVRHEFTQQLDSGLLDFSFNEYITIDIPDDIIQQLRFHIHPEVSLDQIAHFLCLLAFALGGNE
ncbi:hypothetical protein PBOR_03805 [Paenibacillus borealis]|uniref:Uncharacterized protein n=1 Tax=Paenibacillus borealis TaxID=160799 RepID=A0A089L5V7_PAEBO|nr:hypothetical protein PBOR_03805 [Paenibacillus borealis]